MGRGPVWGGGQLGKGLAGGGACFPLGGAERRIPGPRGSEGDVVWRRAGPRESLVSLVSVRTPSGGVAAQHPAGASSGVPAGRGPNEGPGDREAAVEGAAVGLALPSGNEARKCHRGWLAGTGKEKAWELGNPLSPGLNKEMKF